MFRKHDAPRPQQLAWDLHCLSDDRAFGVVAAEARGSRVGPGTPCLGAMRFAVRPCQHSRRDGHRWPHQASCARRPSIERLEHNSCRAMAMCASLRAGGTVERVPHLPDTRDNRSEVDAKARADRDGRGRSHGPHATRAWRRAARVRSVAASARWGSPQAVPVVWVCELTAVTCVLTPECCVDERNRKSK